jgi:hypothetical protein
VRRLLAVLALTFVATPLLGGAASADPLPVCIPVPDLDGHVWELCIR